MELRDPGGFDRGKDSLDDNLELRYCDIISVVPPRSFVAQLNLFWSKKM